MEGENKDIFVPISHSAMKAAQISDIFEDKMKSCLEPSLLRSYFVDKNVLSDVTFLVGTDNEPISIRAHKCLLAMASPVFMRMFSSGGFKEQNTCSSPAAIKVIDIEPDIFIQLLRYIYSDLCTITKESVFKIWYAAEKYMIVSLINICENFCLKQLDDNMVWKLFDFNRFFEKPEINQHCLDKILENPMHYFENPDFLTLSPGSANLLLDSEEMNCCLFQLRNAFLKWYQSQHPRNSSKKSLKRVLEKVCSLVVPKNLFTGCIREYCLEAGITSKKNMSSSSFQFKINNDCYLYGLGLLICISSNGDAIADRIEDSLMIKFSEICGPLKKEIFCETYTIKSTQQLKINDLFFPKILFLKNVYYQLNMEFGCKRERFINTSIKSRRFNVVKSCNIKNPLVERLLASSGHGRGPNRNALIATTSLEHNLRAPTRPSGIELVRCARELRVDNFVTHFIFKDL